MNNSHTITVRELDEFERRSQLDVSNQLSREEVEKRHIENEHLKDTYKSLCFTCNKSMTKYFIQSSVLTGIIIFSCLMLAYGSEPRDLYVSLLSSSIGLLIPTGFNEQQK